MTESREYLTRREVAAEWPFLPYDTLRYYTVVGRGPKSFKVGKRRLYRRADIESWLAEQYQETAS
jgi:hypothetical protein